MVSVIVPVYKTEQFLRECLASVSSQSFTDWECIVVDDGSGDPELIGSISAEVLGEKGVVIHQSNQGVSAARNVGVAATKGRYVLCLDSDDYLHSEYLTRTTAGLQGKSGTSIAFCWTQCVGKQNEIMRPTSVETFWLLQRNLITTASLFEREVWETLGGFDESMRSGHEDWEFWIRASLAGYTFVGIPEILFYYRDVARSKNKNATRERHRNTYYIRHKHSDVYFLPLRQLLTRESFRNVQNGEIVRFWLSGIFYHFVPAHLRTGIFRLYQLVKDR